MLDLPARLESFRGTGNTPVMDTFTTTTTSDENLAAVRRRLGAILTVCQIGLDAKDSVEAIAALKLIATSSDLSMFYARAAEGPRDSGGRQ